MLTLAEAAAETGRNPELLRRWCAAGRLRCGRIGRDWVVGPAELVRIDAMPRKGASKHSSEIRLADLGVLLDGLRSEVEACLDEGEAVQVVVSGVEDAAIIVTDRRILVARDGALVREPERGETATWPLEWARRVQLEAGASAGALVLTPREPADRALVVVLARPHLARAEAATTRIRELLAGAGAYGSKGGG